MAGSRGLAKQIRTRLDATNKKAQAEETFHALDELYFGRPKRVHVAEFGAILAIIALIVAGVKGYGGQVMPSCIWSLAAVAIAGVGYRIPLLLYPLWRAWMALAHVLGTIMTFLILLIMWCFVLIPIAFLLKILRIKVVDMSHAAPVESYWEERPDKLHDFKLLERQF